MQLSSSAFIWLDTRQNLYYIPTNVRTWWTPRLYYANRPNLLIFAYVAFATRYCHELDRLRFSYKSIMFFLNPYSFSLVMNVPKNNVNYTQRLHVREILEDLVRSKGA